MVEDARANGEIIKGIILDNDQAVTLIKDTGIITLPRFEDIKSELENGNTSLRGREKRNQLMSSVLDVKTFYDKGILHYFIGSIGEGMHQNINNASCVRAIIDNGTNQLFTKLLPLLTVDFVRNGQLTVVPFSFKYLREYCNKISRE